MCLLYKPIYFFGERSVQICLPISKWIFVLILLNFKSSLYILGIEYISLSQVEVFNHDGVQFMRVFFYGSSFGYNT